MAADPLAVLFEQAGYTLIQDSKGRYYQGIWKLIDGDWATLRYLRDVPLLRLLLNAQWRKGKAFTYRELLGVAQPGSTENLTRFNEALYALLAHQLVLRGYTIQCPVCDLTAWYDLSRIVDPTCQGCLSPLVLPLELTFAFRLNRLFQEGLKQGALTVLLTLLYYMEQSPDDVLWQVGYNVQQDGLTADIDLVIRDENGLYLIECKDNFPAKNVPPQSDTIVSQLEANRRIAEQIQATGVVLATLCEQVPESLLHAVSSSGVRILGRKELLRN